VVDTVEDIWRSANVMRRGLGLPSLSRQRVRGYIGRGMRRLVGTAIPLSARHRYDEAVGLFWAHYRAHLLDRSRLYPGVMEILRHYRRTPKAVVTNNVLGLARPILEGLGIARYFRAVLGGDSLPLAKPSPDPIFPDPSPSRPRPLRGVRRTPRRPHGAFAKHLVRCWPGQRSLGQGSAFDSR